MSIALVRATLERARAFTLTCVEDFNESELRRGAEWGLNCTAWILGHLAYTQLRLCLALPFGVAIDDPDDWKGKFGRGSVPIDPSQYPSLDVLRGKLADSLGRSLAMLDVVKDADLLLPPANVLPSFPHLATRADQLLQCALHESQHTGQILWLRKGLGKLPPANFR